MIDCFKDKYTPVCDTEIKKCAKSYCKPIDFRPDYYFYKLYTFVELLSVNRYSKHVLQFAGRLARNIQEIFFHCGYIMWEYSLWQSDLLLLLFITGHI